MGSRLWDLRKPGSCPRRALISCTVVGCLRKGPSGPPSRTNALCQGTVPQLPLNLGWPRALLWPKECGGGDIGPVLSLSLWRFCALLLSLPISKPCCCRGKKARFVCWRVRGKWPSHLITCGQPHAKGGGARTTQLSPTYILDTLNCEPDKWWLF